jgi:alanyl-tRNA synthetase
MSNAAGEAQLPVVMRTRIREELAELQKIVKQHDKERSKASTGSVVEEARRIAEESTGGLIVAAIDNADADGLRTAMDVIRKKNPDAALLLGATIDGKVSFVAAVPAAMIAKGLKAGDWVREVAKVAGGGGGGRPDMAQAGGTNPANLAAALAGVKAWVETKA